MDARLRILAAIRDQFPGGRDKIGADHVLSLDVLKEVGGTALIDDMAIEIDQRGLPNTFVPGRNVLFLTAAAALAYRRGCSDLVGGMCETDYSGYPDCRDATIKACEQAISLSMDQPFTIHTPLMFIDKAATWELAQELGGTTLVDLIVEETVTCYLGDRTRRHAWGYGCNRCPACELRARGYQQYAAGR
jgi:7-cyano-7-deazaguanine synthase